MVCAPQHVCAACVLSTGPRVASLHLYYFPSCYRPSGFRRTRPPSPSALGEILCYHERRFPPPCSLGGHGVVVKSVQYMQHRKGLRRVLLLLEQLGCNPVCDTTVLPYETEGNRPGTQLRRCVHAGVCAHCHVLACCIPILNDIVIRAQDAVTTTLTPSSSPARASSNGPHIAAHPSPLVTRLVPL